MSRLRRWLDSVAPHVAPGGRWRFMHAVYEMVDTILYSPMEVTRTAAHVRDGLDLKRMMMLVVVALLPAMAMAVYNTGYQANLAIAYGALPLESWQTWLMGAAGVGFSPDSFLACTLHGALYFFPILIVTFAAGGLVEVLGATLRNHEVNEGFLVTGVLIPLTLPPTVPLWQVALGTAFGVLFGKEVFGGTGMNFLNPALLTRAFLFFAYPAQLSGQVWVAAQPVLSPVGEAVGVDAVTGATLLVHAEAASLDVSAEAFWRAFWGLVPGSMGETSTFACLLGAALLLVTRIASARIMLGVVVGTALSVWLFDWLGDDANALMHVPLSHHFVMGGWAFGTVFMATDPVTAPHTERARFAYGVLIGVVAMLVRVVNPAYPEGMMLAILFMNTLAPLLDHFVVRANIRRRERRYGS